MLISISYNSVYFYVKIISSYATDTDIIILLRYVDRISTELR